MKTVHTSVLLKESVEGLNLEKNPQSLASGNNLVVVDGTFGGGGHSIEILKNYQNVKVIGIDQDKSAWDKAKDKFVGLEDRITFVNGNFRDIKEIVETSGVGHRDSRCPTPEVDGVLLDLGLSSDQLENSGRGFTFMKDEPLFMTMKANPSSEDLTVQDIVNNWSEENIANIIYGYGEERFSRRIARLIVEARKVKKIKTTFELVEIIKNAVPKKFQKGKINPATKTFQALRMAVNDELNTLEFGLSGGFDILKIRGRMSVISFHSLEDRIVKNFYKKKVAEGKAKLINKKIITAGIEELKTNNRSRSAKLRVLEKISN